MRFNRHIGIDHAFSFPLTYMRRYGIESWSRFLDDFMRHWPTADPHTYVELLRDGNPRTGVPDELWLCEQWTASAESVFQFDVQGSVAKSTHAGLPWLLWLREMPEARERIHFWPFDGFEVPVGKSVVAEVYPSLFRRRYQQERRTAHGLMVQAIEREVAREERLQAFVEEALEADRAIEAGGEVYAADDVHAWLERLAQGKRPARPKPWRE